MDCIYSGQGGKLFSGQGGNELAAAIVAVIISSVIVFIIILYYCSDQNYQVTQSLDIIAKKRIELLFTAYETVVLPLNYFAKDERVAEVPPSILSLVPPDFKSEIGAVRFNNPLLYL